MVREDLKRSFANDLQAASQQTDPFGFFENTEPQTKTSDTFGFFDEPDGQAKTPSESANNPTTDAFGFFDDSNPNESDTCLSGTTQKDHQGKTHAD